MDKKAIEKSDRLCGTPSEKNPCMLRIKSTHARKHWTSFFSAHRSVLLHHALARADFCRRISDEADFHQTCLHTISQKSDRAKTWWRTTLRRAEKKHRLDSEHAWIFLRWSSTQTIWFFYHFFIHRKNLKHVLFFFTDGKKTDGAHTRSVCPMKTVHRSVFIGQTDRVYRA